MVKGLILPRYILGDGEDGDEEAAEAEVEILAVEGF